MIVQAYQIIIMIKSECCALTWHHTTHQDEIRYIKVKLYEICLKTFCLKDFSPSRQINVLCIMLTHVCSNELWERNYCYIINTPTKITTWQLLPSLSHYFNHIQHIITNSFNRTTAIPYILILYSLYVLLLPRLQAQQTCSLHLLILQCSQKGR